jgi:hypothetical protein
MSGVADTARYLRYAFMSTFDSPDSPSRLLSEDCLFCETGTLLALNFLRTAHTVVEKAHEWSADVLHAAMYAALVELLSHRATCKNCK